MKRDAVHRQVFAGFTQTDEGRIPYAVHHELGIVLAPRIKRTYLPSQGYWVTGPEKDAQGRFVYVLPGGRDYVRGDE